MLYHINNRIPKVSVIMAVYNRASFLSRSINSLIDQTFEDWELVAVDDGSTDNTLEILKEFESKNKKIKIYRHSNRKLPLTRNKGISESKGAIITFLDSDDEIETDHLEKHYNFMINNPNIDLIHGSAKIIGDEFVRDKYDSKKLIHLSECAIGGTFFGKRKVFIELNGFKNIEYSEDSEFLERAGKIFNIRKVNFNTYKYYRDTVNSITNNYEPK